MIERNIEIAGQVLRDLAIMNVGPGQSVPKKTIWLRSQQRGTSVADLEAALDYADDAGYLTFSPGGICGLGSYTLTPNGYQRSREF